jgi:hypothetical protein
VTLDGNVQVRGCASEGIVIHFATSNVERFIYRYLLQRINEPGNPPDKRFYWKLRLKCLPLDIKVPVVRKIKRTIKYALPQSWRERIISRK